MKGTEKSQATHTTNRHAHILDTCRATLTQTHTHTGIQTHSPLFEIFSLFFLGQGNCIGVGNAEQLFTALLKSECIFRRINSVH